MFSEAMLFQAEQKNNRVLYWYKIFLFKKNCISKLFIKMFIKRKTRVGKT